MAEYNAEVIWTRNGEVFTDNKYSRGHLWRFDGIEVPASSSPHVVKIPQSIAEAIDPEEAFVASLSSCHMLWFLHIAAKGGFVVDQYRDSAVGVMGKDASGKLAMTRVTLHPQTVFAGSTKPSWNDVLVMHHEAHEQCFIANSVKTVVTCEPVP